MLYPIINHPKLISLSFMPLQQGHIPFNVFGKYVVQTRRLSDGVITGLPSLSGT
jgi:hypothetical protein